MHRTPRLPCVPVLRIGGNRLSEPGLLHGAVQQVRAAAEASSPVVVVAALRGVEPALERMLRPAPAGSRERGFEAGLDELHARHVTVLEAVAAGRPLRVAREDFARQMRRLRVRLEHAADQGEIDSEGRDEVVAAGGRLAAPLFVAALAAAGLEAEVVDAIEVLQSHGPPGSSDLDLAATAALARARLLRPGAPVAVVPGGLAGDERGGARRLGPRGSARAAAALAAALNRVDPAEARGPAPALEARWNGAGPPRSHAAGR
ncbi:MAG: hypothetical protein HZB25_11490 [Candidatus Eisenbacteria bacterium]|nr:hypothetical protein [Candidatus Eisenbacteria bacterium]